MWFLAIWFATSQKNGVSALSLQRVLGLGSYETAWTWLHKLRRAMVRPGRDRLAGNVEVDETYVGGPEEGVRGRETETKAIVVIAAEPGFAVTGHTREIRKAWQGVTRDGFWACVYAEAGVSAASVTASSCLGIGIPSFFSSSANSPAIFVR